MFYARQIKLPKVFSIILIIAASLLMSALAFAQIDRVEPPHWWVGMANQELQLMVHGQNIAGMSVTTSDDAIEVSGVHSADNPNYLFVDLQLTAELQAGMVELRFQKDGDAPIIYVYEFRARKPGTAELEGFSAKDVIYLITPDRFANGNEANDEVDALFEKTNRSHPGGRHGGDLQGITDHLEYLEKLGVTQIWLNPLQENNQEEYSYHGYSMSDLYNIDARFGGNEDFLKLADRAAELGISLIMDTVPNHIGLNHWWMADLPSKDWINNNAQFMPTSHRHITIQDPHSSEADRVQFNDGWFVPTMPDLNQRNSDLATYLIQNNIWWVESAKLSGLRVDTLPYADKHFTSQFTRRLLQEYPKLNIVGEEWSGNPAMVSYWQSGKQNQDGFSGNVPSLMDFPLQEALIQALLEDEAEGKGLIRLYKVLANDFQYPDPNNLVVITDNHDMSRILTQLDEQLDLFKMSQIFIMTTRGIPQLFYGTEILMNNPGTGEHGVIRSDFPGGWAGDKKNAFNGKGLSKAQKDTQKFISRLLNWRKGASVVHTGSLTHFVPRDGVYTYFRHDAEDMVMVAINKNNTASQLDMSRFAELVAAKQTAVDIMTGQSHAIENGITIPARSAMLLELK